MALLKKSKWARSIEYKRRLHRLENRCVKCLDNKSILACDLNCREAVQASSRHLKEQISRYS